MNLIPRPRPLLLMLATVLLAGCLGDPRPTPPTAATPPPVVPKVRIGIALGGGAAKGFAHIGVIKMLQTHGLEPVVVAGTSAGSVVGALYASGMDPARLQRHAIALDEDEIRDISLFSGGLIEGRLLQDYVNRLVSQRPIDKFAKPFAAVATRLEDGKRSVFVRGDAGQAVRASSSIPGVFEPVTIGKWHYVDGGVVSPVPVDAARQLGAELVVAVDISSRASGTMPGSLLGIVDQSITIMGRQLAAQELARAEVVIRPRVNDIGATDFEQRDRAILAGEQAALAAIPQIRAQMARMRQARIDAVVAKTRAAAATRARAIARCKEAQGWFDDESECDGATVTDASH